MIAQFLVHWGFVLSALAMIGYAIAVRRQSPHWAKVGRWLFALSAVVIGVIVGWHLVNVIGHRFEYTYVWRYSSRELTLPLLVASAYSGQEGSFLLWIVWVVLLGIGVVRYARKYQREAAVMVWYMAILTFLMLMVVAKNPFEYVWETFAADGVTVGMVPQNGKGLNPLLHNLWITIHPPMLFLGFAAMGVPFAFAMAALLQRDYHQWIRIAFPWALLAAAVLGLGIMLGGFWAYETLGWGGFWGWDPVENSSLIPWLVAVVLVHTMLTQLRTRGLFKTNIILTVFSFLFVLYSTFLTRSGVLGDTSVHSFVDPGYFAYVLLLGGMIGFAAISFGLLWSRRSDLRKVAFEGSLLSREFWLGIGVILLLAVTIVLLVGTSWPIILDVLGQPKVAIDIAFYNKMGLPIAVFLLLANGISLLVRWKSTPLAAFRRSLLVYLLGAILAVGGFFIAGLRDVAFLVFVFAAVFALLVNLEWIWILVRRQPRLIGAYLSHFGLAILFLGVITYSQFQQQIHLPLPQGQPKKFGDYQFTFLGKQQVEKEFRDREKYEYLIAVEDLGSGSQFILKPVLYWSAYNNWEAAFLEPGIAWGIRSDLYIAPKSVEIRGNPVVQRLMKGQSLLHPFDSLWTVHFVGFDMSQAQQVQGNLPLRLGARVQLVHRLTETSIDTTVWTVMRGRQWRPEPLQIPGTALMISLEKIIPNRSDLGRSQVEFALYSLEVPDSIPQEIFVAEITIKPLIGLVWIGTILTVLGFFVAAVRRWRELQPKKASTLSAQKSVYAPPKLSTTPVSEREAEQR